MWDTFLTSLGLGELPHSRFPYEISRTTRLTYLQAQTRTQYLTSAGVAYVQDLDDWAPHYRHTQRCQRWWLNQTAAPDLLQTIVHALDAGGLFGRTETPLYVA